MHRALLILVLSGFCSHAEDRFSVNFASFGRATPGDAWAEIVAQATVKLDAADSAGAPGFATTGWLNVMPAPGTTELTSTEGNTAMLNLLSQRSASPYHWTRTRSAATHDSPDATLMDGKTHGTVFRTEQTSIQPQASWWILARCHSISPVEHPTMPTMKIRISVRQAHTAGSGPSRTRPPKVPRKSTSPASIPTRPLRVCSCPAM